MTMKCCGDVDLTTAYCPTCGRPNRGAAFPIKGLLHYLKTRGSSALKRHETDKEWMATELCRLNDWEREKRFKNGRQTAARWKRWADALEELIGENEKDSQAELLSEDEANDQE